MHVNIGKGAALTSLGRGVNEDIAHSQSLAVAHSCDGFWLPTSTTLPRFGAHATACRGPAVMPPAQTGHLKTAYLAFGLRASELVDGGLCLFWRVEHGPEPAGHL